MTLKSQYGIKLGETRILYVDEEKKFLQLVVQDPRRQRRLFIEWAEWASKQSGDSETSSGETQNSGNLGMVIFKTHLLFLRLNAKCNRFVVVSCVQK